MACPHAGALRRTGVVISSAWASLPVCASQRRKSSAWGRNVTRPKSGTRWRACEPSCPGSNESSRSWKKRSTNAGCFGQRPGPRRSAARPITRKSHGQAHREGTRTTAASTPMPPSFTRFITAGCGRRTTVKSRAPTCRPEPCPGYSWSPGHRANSMQWRSRIGTERLSGSANDSPTAISRSPVPSVRAQLRRRPALHSLVVPLQRGPRE
jgi:hypothetical protein